jgi:putative ABC transport system substrate-binding protein
MWRTVEDRVNDAALARGLKTIMYHADALEEVEAAFQKARLHAQAIVVTPDSLFIQYRDRIVAAAAKAHLPAIYGWPTFAKAGGLMSYSADPAENWERVAVYVDKILHGTNAGDLPIAQPSRFALTLNAKTAKALGLRVPESISVRAEEVIR